MPRSHAKLKLPQLEQVSLHRFSLYAANPDADFDCGDGVLCIIGANGLGKSTLLSAINFCLTGVVSQAGQSFRSMEEYYSNSRAYSSNYFRGRISEGDRAEAEIAIEFRVGDFHYGVKRGLFEPEELRALTITRISDQAVELETENASRRERQLAY